MAPRAKIVGGQKVRGFHPRAVDLLEPVRLDVREYLLATGIRGGILFPRRDGDPWRLHDYQNWRRRVSTQARESVGIEALPPYDLRHAFASLQIRAGMSIPELAEQLGHSPQMTVMTYTHVIRELKGEPRMAAEEQIIRARSAAGGPYVDPLAATDRNCSMPLELEVPAKAGNSSGWIRTIDLTIMSRALSPLSYGAEVAEFSPGDANHGGALNGASAARVAGGGDG